MIRVTLDGAPALRWRLDDRKMAWLVTALAVVSLLFAFAVFAADLAADTAHHFGDFFPLWSYAQIAATQGPAALYDQDLVHRAQVAFGMPVNAANPYPYPPPMLLLLWPLSVLPYDAGFAVWSGSMLLACLAALCGGMRCRAILAVAMLLAPSTAACLVTGQSGFLLAALLAGGLRLVRRRPVVAGLVLGLLAYKPQWGIMVPVALAAARQYRSVAAAAAMVLALMAVTSILYGPALWLDWLMALPAYQDTFGRMARAELMPTVAGNAALVGLPGALAAAVQTTATATAAYAVWSVWRPGANRTAIPVTLAAALLATPHAFLYDLPVLTAGALMFAADRYRARHWLTTAEVAVISAVLVLPAAMSIAGAPLPLSTPVILALLHLTHRAALQTTRAGRPAPGYAACGTPAATSAAA